MVSLDGYIEGPQQNIDWHNWEEEMSAYMMGFFHKVDTFLYGRKSYELMLEYWPYQTGSFADIMNATPKIIFSKTLDKPTWNATRKSEVKANELKQLKKEKGKDMVLFAGADLAESFIRQNLIDEYRLIVNPVALGHGKPLFGNLLAPLQLQHQESRRFSCGNVLQVYQPALAEKC